MKTWNGYQRGINFGGWLSQCDHTKERYETFILEEDVKRVAEWGLDHVRVPVDYNLVEDDDGNYKEEGFGYIAQAIGWCQKYGLNMVLDLHKTYGYSFDAGEKEEGFFEKEEYQERFYKLWEQFASRFGQYKQMLAFELLNEVTDKEIMPIWNRIAAECIRRIRSIVSDIDILVGGYWNNSVLAVKDLLLPPDEHIIYNFHCYEPLIFTHQGAYWVDGMSEEYRFSLEQTLSEYYRATKENIPDSLGTLPEFSESEMKQIISQVFFQKLFEEAVAVAEERNVALYCGEYGVIELADIEDTKKWFVMIHATFEEHGIGRAAWSYRGMDFGLINEHYAPILEEVLSNL